MPYRMMPCEQDAMERGLSQGLEQGLKKGILQKGRENIIDILVLRFSEVPSEISDRINKLSEESVLRELLRRSVAIQYFWVNILFVIARGRTIQHCGDLRARSPRSNLPDEA